MKPLSARILVLALAALCFGCQPGKSDLYSQLQDESPSARVAAIVTAADQRDDKAIPHLVDRLTDSDKAVRFYAIMSLERITDQTMDYRHYDPPEERRKAVKRWRQWLTDRNKTAPP